MAIKMRTNKDEKAVCKCCGATRKHSLDMFDIAFTDKHIITLSLIHISEPTRRS